MQNAFLFYAKTQRILKFLLKRTAGSYKLEWTTPEISKVKILKINELDLCVLAVGEMNR